ncbi:MULTISPECIES: LysR substrate-binding domain-containing protein [unclassified Caballeronia]|uniref:LysR substrate-binding domain-containing protein n=1 Tax=unclassified Caballeronia TaxID=2646786 RepID=UPI0020278A58|nr:MULTISPECIES: LysR substrate-binding domain-containing protein [unclassified Caballeronia]MDR5765844.1 LysR substrate-binding domain-containing protein [Caballeronia sp. LZ028]
MDVKQLRYFAAVVEAGSLSKAALKLAISQPSLSHLIATMEEDVGVELLLRSPSGVRPTDSGTTLYRHAKTILRQFDQMRDEVSLGCNNEVGRVAVGLPTSVAAVIAPKLFAELREKSPGIQLELFESMSGYLVELLANGRLDMGVLFRDIETTGITVLPLINENLSLYGLSKIGRRKSATVRLRDLDGIPLVLPTQSSGLRLLVERVFAREGVGLNAVGDIDSLPTMLAVAAQGNVGTILSSALGKLPIATMPYRTIVEPELARTISLCIPNAIPQNAASRAVQRTIERLIQEHSALWKQDTT